MKESDRIIRQESSRCPKLMNQEVKISDFPFLLNPGISECTPFFESSQVVKKNRGTMDASRLKSSNSVFLLQLVRSMLRSWEPTSPFRRVEDTTSYVKVRVPGPQLV